MADGVTAGRSRLAVPRPADRCYDCRRSRAEVEQHHTELVLVDGKWKCRDRVDCYEAWRTP